MSLGGKWVSFLKDKFQKGKIDLDNLNKFDFEILNKIRVYPKKLNYFDWLEEKKN